MPCSTCRIDVLRSFLYTFGVQHVKPLPGNTSKTLQRRAIHSGTVLRLSSTSLRSTAPLSQDVAPTAIHSHSYIPFATSTTLASTTQSTLPANVPRKRRLPTFIETSELKLGEDHFFEDTSILESGVHEPDVSLYTGSKSHQLTRDGIKVKTSTSDRRVTGMRKRKTYGPGGRSHKGGRVPTLIPRTEEKVARSTTEKATAGKMLPNPQEPWGVQKTALEQKFGEQGWAPRKRLSPDALDGIRALHAQYPEDYPTAVLAEQFKVSPEAIRRILKSKWRPNEEEDVSRRQRWQKRGETIWGQMVELGVKAPKKWRDLGIGRINKSDSGREKPRARSQTADKRVVAQAATNDLLKAPMVIAKADQLVKRSLSDRIL